MSRPRIIISVITRFCEKAHMLIAEAVEILKQNKQISEVMAIIIAHQAAEIALKGACIFQDNSIYKHSGVTITFDEALNRSSNIISGADKTVFSILNDIRNNYQHHAIYDNSGGLDTKDLIFDTISIIISIFDHIGYDADELKLIIDNEVQMFNSISTGLDEEEIRL